MKKNFICILLLISSLIACNYREEKLIKAGNILVNKIESFRIKNGNLPTSLSDIGVKESEGGPLFYEKRDSINFMVWFGTSLGESKTYYSNSKKWEEHQRK